MDKEVFDVLKEINRNLKELLEVNKKVLITFSKYDESYNEEMAREGFIPN